MLLRLVESSEAMVREGGGGGGGGTWKVKSRRRSRLECLAMPLLKNSASAKGMVSDVQDRGRYARGRGRGGRGTTPP